LHDRAEVYGFYCDVNGGDEAQDAALPRILALLQRTGDPASFEGAAWWLVDTLRHDSPSPAQVAQLDGARAVCAAHPDWRVAMWLFDIGGPSPEAEACLRAALPTCDTDYVPLVRARLGEP
jgi:hypothetical protein